MSVMKSLQGLPRLISASVGAPGKARNLPADVQCIQYLFNLIIPKMGFALAENGKCDGQLVQCISQYQFRHLKYAHPDGVIDPTGRTFNSLIEEAVKVPVKAYPTMRIPSFLNVFGNNSGDAVQATVNVYLDRMRAMVEAERRNRQLMLQSTCDGGMTLTDTDFQNAATQLGNGISVNIIKAFGVFRYGQVRNGAVQTARHTQRCSAMGRNQPVAGGRSVEVGAATEGTGVEVIVLQPGVGDGPGL
jgi:hypothetical protein